MGVNEILGDTVGAVGIIVGVAVDGTIVGIELKYETNKTRHERR